MPDHINCKSSLEIYARQLDKSLQQHIFVSVECRNINWEGLTKIVQSNVNQSSLVLVEKDLPWCGWILTKIEVDQLANAWDVLKTSMWTDII